MTDNFIPVVSLLSRLPKCHLDFRLMRIVIALCNTSCLSGSSAQKRTPRITFPSLVERDSYVLKGVLE